MKSHRLLGYMLSASILALLAFAASRPARAATMAEVEALVDKGRTAMKNKPS